MKEIPLTALEIDTALTGYICHKSGEILHSPGEILSRVQRALLHQCDIDTVLVVEPDQSLEEIKIQLQYQKVKLEDISPGEPVPVALYDKNNVAILQEGDVFSDKLLSKLTGEGITELSLKKDAMELERFQVQKYKFLLESDKRESLELVADPDSFLNENSTDPVSEESDETVESIRAEPIPEDRFLQNPSKYISQSVCKQLMTQPELLHIQCDIKKVMEPRRKIDEREDGEKEAYKTAYMKWVVGLEELFAKLKSNTEIDFSAVETIAGEIIDHYLNDCFYCLNLLNMRHPPIFEKYLILHCVNVAIASTAIGVKVGFPVTLLRELVIGALLHDIGHLFTYRPLLAKKELDSTEQHKYDHHAIVGMAMLKNMTRVPMSTMLVVIQHHECCNGTGRIFHASAKQLHDFSRIVSVANYFEAACRFSGTSHAMVQTVNSGQAGELDIVYVREFLSIMSVYPIGAALRLHSGLLCKVIGTDPKAFKTPLLRSVYSMSDDHLFPIDTCETIDLRKRTEMRIVEEVSHSALKSDIAKGF